MKVIYYAFLIFSVFSCTSNKIVSSSQKAEAEKSVNTLLNSFHSAAARANFTGYFSLFSKNARFIGTDATENWNVDSFKIFSEPYFKSGKAWDFKTLQRNIYLSDNGQVAWFDELLDTWMKICRGSGTCVLENGVWKISHYVLSVTVPNDKIREIMKVKGAQEDSLINILKQK